MGFPSFVQESFNSTVTFLFFVFVYWYGITSYGEHTIYAEHNNITPPEVFSVGCLPEQRPNSWTKFTQKS
jgi:hypothetical protein